jgi:hypothetical protein
MLRAFVPNRWKGWWWFATDPAYRQRYTTIQSVRRQRERGWAAATAVIWPQSNGRIISGPFAELRYVRSAGRNVFPQKLLGTYERELVTVVEAICQIPYEGIIDIGAAEGYYVCGLASRIRGARVTAFEADHALHETLREIATLNHLEDRIDLRGMCTVETLRSVCAVDLHRLLIICDAEGAEELLLDPIAIPQLRTADILVEVHDDIRPDVSQQLQDRFKGTHRITTIAPEKRGLNDLPSRIALDSAIGMAAMDECRGSQNGWLWMTTNCHTVAIPA